MVKSGGFITLHRKIMEWEWYKNANTFCLFIHLLLSANYEDGRFEGKVIRRGQLVTSLPSLSTDVGLSIQQTRTALAHLISTGEITDEATTQYRLITIVNYDRYQTKQQTDQQTINRRSTDESTDDQQTNQQQYNNNNNITNINKGTKNNHPVQSGEDGFSGFWAIYPRKEAKQNALAAWKKLKPDEELIGKIAQSIANWRQSEQWTKENGRYIPLPASWLNGRRWEDEIRPARSEPAPAPTKRVIAQDFEQRDYSDVPDQQMQSLADEIAAWKKTGKVW